MLELYHAPISTCSQKVRMALCEKGLDWTDRLVDLQKGEQFAPDYVKLNPNAVVPTLVDDGRALIESTLINEYVDDQYPGVPLKPDRAAARHAMRLFTKQTDDQAQPAIAVLTYAIGARPMLLAQPKEQVMEMFAKIPLEAKRNARISVYEHGVAAPEVAAAIKTFVALFKGMEARLNDHVWLAGPDISLADIAAMPYALRIDHLGLSPMIREAGLPKLSDWYGRICARPSFEPAVTKYAPPPVVELFQSEGQKVWADIEKLIAAA